MTESAAPQGHPCTRERRFEHAGTNDAPGTVFAIHELRRCVYRPSLEVKTMLVFNRIQNVPVFPGFPRAAFVARSAASTHEFAPAMNVSETDSDYTIEAELPGFRMEDIEVAVLGDEVTIKGQRTLTAPDTATYLRRERRGGAFSRTFTLPEHVQVDKVAASLNDGVLLITLPKSPAAQPRKIAVKTGA
jgi:HSP20 family protein